MDLEPVLAAGLRVSLGSGIAVVRVVGRGVVPVFGNSSVQVLF